MDTAFTFSSTILPGYTNNYSYILNAPIDIRSGGNFRTRHGSNAIAQAYTVLNTISEVESINSNGNYVLGSNIDARETVDWNDGKGYEPIYPSTVLLTDWDMW